MTTGRADRNRSERFPVRTCRGYSRIGCVERCVTLFLWSVSLGPGGVGSGVSTGCRVRFDGLGTQRDSVTADDARLSRRRFVQAAAVGGATLAVPAAAAARPRKLPRAGGSAHRLFD